MSRTISSVKKVIGHQGRPTLNSLRVAAAVKETETVSINGKTFEVDSDGVVTAGNIPIPVGGTASAAAAVGTLTATGTLATTETVTIGSTVYTYKTALTGAAYEVLVGTEAVSLANLALAINAGAGAGVNYGTGTVAHPSVTATSTATTLVVTAKAKGTGGNLIASTETATNASWGAADLAGGVDTSASDFTTVFATTAVASAGVTGFTAERISANELLFSSIHAANDGVACTETLSGTNDAWASATTYGGIGFSSKLKGAQVLSRAANASEAALLVMHFVATFPPTAVAVAVRTSAGVAKAFDGTVAGSGNRISVQSTGSTNIAANDVVTLSISD